MRIEAATAETPLELWSAIEQAIAPAERLEEAAQELAARFYTTFEESVVLARVFVTVPFGELPPANQKVVAALADSASTLNPTTPVLSLVGTRGQEEGWNDRRRSNGHVGIPLISSAFVEAIPMIARLLKEIGVPIEWMDSHATDVIVESLGRSTGLFYVEDAARAVDEQGRKIIAAQDFVRSYGVESVFGISGVYGNGQIAVLVVFCRDAFTREAAELLAILDKFIEATGRLSDPSLVFAD
jgi:hypothetical protein